MTLDVILQVSDMAEKFLSMCLLWYSLQRVEYLYLPVLVMVQYSGFSADAWRELTCPGRPTVVSTLAPNFGRTFSFSAPWFRVAVRAMCVPSMPPRPRQRLLQGEDTHRAH